MPLAIFDLDHTLLSCDSDHAWGQFLVDQGLVDASINQRRNDHFYEQYKAGTLDIHEYLAFALEPLTQHSMETLDTLHQQFLKERIEPHISQKAEELILRHRQAGDTLMIITATNGFITYPIGKRLGIDHVIAPDPEILDNRYTGKILGTPSFQEGKVIRLNEWLSRQGGDLQGAFFYSDSHNDLPLLERVDNPVAVDPDDTLRAIATQRGWPVISLLDPSQPE